MHEKVVLKPIAPSEVNRSEREPVDLTQSETNGPTLPTLNATLVAANSGRDYSIYSRAMDAAEIEKAKDTFPHINIPEVGTILDLGAGTGSLSEMAASGKSTIWLRHLAADRLK